MECVLWMLVTTTIVVVNGESRDLGSARLKVIAGGHENCPWKVSLLDSNGDDGGREICTKQLSFSFAGSTTGTTTPSSLTTLPPFYNLHGGHTAAAQDVLPKMNIGITTGTTTPSSFTTLPPGHHRHGGYTAAPEAISKINTGKSSALAPPVGYDRLPNGGYYRLHEEKRQWHGARAACEREGAHLLAIESAEEAAVIRDFINWKNIASQQLQDVILHAGFRLEIVTQEGDTLLFERWGSMEPDNRFCGQIDNDAWLLYGLCSEWRPFICHYQPEYIQKIYTTPNTPVVNNFTKDCSPVVKQFLSKQYMLFWNNTYIKDLGIHGSWMAANESCRSDGAKLLIIDSTQKAEALFDFMALLNIKKLYLGMETQDPVTVLGTPLYDYNRWVNRDAEKTCFYANKKLLFRGTPCYSVNYHFPDVHTVCQIKSSNYNSY